jgi:hypothetical protein
MAKAAKSWVTSMMMSYVAARAALREMDFPDERLPLDTGGGGRLWV